VKWAGSRYDALNQWEACVSWMCHPPPSKILLLKLSGRKHDAILKARESGGGGRSGGLTRAKIRLPRAFRGVLFNSAPAVPKHEECGWRQDLEFFHDANQLKESAEPPPCDAPAPADYQIHPSSGAPEQ